MSIATEITRLQTAKADLKTAIEGKGVTVPSATLLDGYADLVDSISGGGGGHIREAFYLKFRPTETYTKNNPLSLQLEASDNCLILVRAVQFPTADANYYKGLIWAYNVTTYDSTHSYSDVGHRILRPNGTIGSDSLQCSYTKGTGILKMGGEYGFFMSDDEYEVIQIVTE